MASTINSIFILLKSCGDQNSFGNYNITLSYKSIKSFSMTTQENDTTESKTRKSGFFQTVNTKEEANKVIKSVTKFFYLLGGLVLISGIAGILVVPNKSGMDSLVAYVLIIAIGLMILVPAFMLKKKKSIEAGIILLILCFFGILRIMGNFMRGDGGIVANILLLIILSIGLLSSIEAIRTVKKIGYKGK